MPEDGDGTYRALIAELAGLVRLAHTALSGATAALTSPADEVEGVPAAEKALAELRARIEEDAAGLLDGPAGVVVGVHVGTEAEALGQLAQRLLEAAWARQEREPFDEPLRAPLDGIADAALDLVARAADVLESGAPEGVADVLTELHEAGRRQRLLYERLIRAEEADPVDTADLVLLACCYQQCAAHAGSIARHAVLFSHAGASV
ncbi:hypothetical protein F7Q99_00240 [Streptomyces kaniharaensis]|uniref:Phosphate uptake regulator PhoU n=1 Tax=Streptomyces kaniharaensis TaxID=212423 RepID=A0A6N7KJK4_9ACTN|nr:hypothetical protein [Streptomyces kaniharaensis]MQS10749.1 hypothetical protein [Streptomyces kaniharaensis]